MGSEDDYKEKPEEVFKESELSKKELVGAIMESPFYTGIPLSGRRELIKEAKAPYVRPLRKNRSCQLD